MTQRAELRRDRTGVTVQAPIGIAANVCDVTAGVLVRDLRDVAADCDATPDAITTITG